MKCSITVQSVLPWLTREDVGEGVGQARLESWQEGKSLFRGWLFRVCVEGVPDETCFHHAWKFMDGWTHGSWMDVWMDNDDGGTN